MNLCTCPENLSKTKGMFFINALYHFSVLCGKEEKEGETLKYEDADKDDDVTEESDDVTTSKQFILGSQHDDVKTSTDRVPFSLLPKLGGYSVNNPALYRQYSSQPSSIGDFYYDDEYEEDHLRLVISRVKLDDKEEEIVIKDTLDYVFLSMSLASSSPNSLESCESVVEVLTDGDVTLVSEDEKWNMVPLALSVS